MRQGGRTLAVLGVAAAAFAVAGSARAVDLKLLSSWDKSSWPTYAVVDHYVKLVHKDGGGMVKIAISGPEVVPPFEQLQPVSSGVFDMLYTHGVYHAGSKGIALVVDAIGLDPYKRREAGVFDFIDKYYQKHNNVKLIALPTAALNGYHMYLKEPSAAP